MAKTSAKKHQVVSQQEWLAARKALLAKEKEFTKQRDRLSEERRALPWVKIEKSYSFEGPKGRQSLSDLFEGRSQLLVYHFMYGPDWGEGCMSCSFWADTFNGAIEHLKARDVTMVSTSAARQAAWMLAAPAVKLIIAGTRPADIRPRMVTTAPLAFGSITPSALPSGASGISLRPSTLAPISIFL